MAEDRYAKYAGHTEGPWVVDDEGITGPHIWSKMSPSGNGKPGRLIANVCGDDAETEPNANLLGDAPTLLADNESLRKSNAALRDALEGITNVSPPDTSHLSAAAGMGVALGTLDKAKAIARAALKDSGHE